MNNQSDNNFTYSESTPFDESEINFVKEPRKSKR